MPHRFVVELDDFLHAVGDQALGVVGDAVVLHHAGHAGVHVGSVGVGLHHLLEQGFALFGAPGGEAGLGHGKHGAGRQVGEVALQGNLQRRLRLRRVAELVQRDGLNRRQRGMAGLLAEGAAGFVDQAQRLVGLAGGSQRVALDAQCVDLKAVARGDDGVAFGEHLGHWPLSCMASMRARRRFFSSSFSTREANRSAVKGLSR